MNGKKEIIVNEKGEKVVVIPSILFKGKRNVDWKEVEKYLREYVGKSYDIIETSEKIYIGTDFPDEFSGSKDTKELRGAWAKAKANSVQGLEEIIQIADNRSFSPNYEEKHGKDAKYGWYRYDARFALPVCNDREEIERYNVYLLRMLVRHAEDGKKYLYDFLRIKKETSMPHEP